MNQDEKEIDSNEDKEWIWMWKQNKKSTLQTTMLKRTKGKSLAKKKLQTFRIKIYRLTAPV